MCRRPFEFPCVKAVYATSGVPVKHGFYSRFRQLNKSFTGTPRFAHFSSEILFETWQTRAPTAMHSEASARLWEYCLGQPRPRVLQLL